MRQKAKYEIGYALIWKLKATHNHVNEAICSTCLWLCFKWFQPISE